MKTNLKSAFLRKILWGFIYAGLFFSSLQTTFSQAISPYLIGQNAWMPEWYGGNLSPLWDDMKLAGYQTIRIGGNGAMQDNKDYTKLMTLINGVRAAGAEPIVQIPHDYSAQQTIDYYNYINVTMNKGIKLWSIGNEPGLNNVGDAYFVAGYVKRISSALKSKDPNAIVLATDEASYDGGKLSLWLGGGADISGKDANGNYYIDVITWHTYNFNDAGGIEANVNDVLNKLAAVNANRPVGKKISWGIGEINTHWDMSLVTNPDQYTWSFHAGQLFAELYDIGMRKGGFTICPWAMLEHGGDRSGTDLSLFDGDLKGRATYYHSLMLGQNMKKNYVSYTDNQADIKVIPMADETGIAVMILNTSKTNGYTYSLKLDNGTIAASPLQIKVNAGVNVQVQGIITAYSTQMLVFCPDGTLLKKYTYTSTNSTNRQGPTIEVLATTCAPACNNAPTIAAVSDKTFEVGSGNQNIDLTGISDGDNCTQGVTITATSSNNAIASIASINYTSCNPTGTLTINPVAKGTALITVTVKDNGKVDCAPVSKSISFTVNVNQAVTIPAKIEAEDYTNMQGIQLEATTDLGGGQNVGYTDATDYLDYYINVPVTGNYVIDFRVASNVTTGQFDIRNQSGTTLATITQAATGGWQTWVTKSATVNLPAGKQILKIYYTGAGLNLNWFEIKSVAPVLTSIIVTPATAEVLPGETLDFNATGYDQNGNVISITPTWSVTGGGTINTSSGLFTASTFGGPFNVTATSGAITGTAKLTVLNPGVTIPGIVQAENFETMMGIQVEATTDAGGGQNIGYIDAGDWLTYKVNVTEAGTYTVNFRVAGWAATGRIALQNAANTTLTAANIPNTGTYQTWATVSDEASFNLAAGSQTIRIFALGAPFNLNWFEIKKVEQPVLTTITVAPANSTINKGQTQQYTAVGKDQFGANMAITPVWTTTGGTINYTGLYTGTTVGSFSVKAQSGNIFGTANIVVNDLPSFAIPGKIEAEAYSDMLGIQTEACTDAGGGLNIGYVDVGDWLDYRVNVSTAGIYNVSFRVASALATGAFQLKNGTTVLATITVPNTGGWQNWVTVSASINLPVGIYPLRIQATGAGLNLNWIDFSQSTSIKIEAESYITMKGIQTETTTDAGGGLNVGYTDPTDYMDYQVNIPTTGTYTLNFRVASFVATGKFELRNQAGTVLATITQGSTGGWQNWITKSATANLTAGSQVLRIYYIGAGLNLNWFEITNSSLKSAPMATESNKSYNSILAYPNPVVDYLSVEVNESNYTHMSIVDMSGRIKSTFELTPDQTTYKIDFRNYKNGIYFLRFSNNQTSEIHRLIKR